MIIDNFGMLLMPDGWEVWMTGSKWQAIKKGATENDKNSWSGLVNTRGEAIRFAKRAVKRK